MSQERKPGQPGTLYLIPCPIAEDTPVWDVLPAANRAVIDSLDYFIVENVRSARRFLSKAGFGRPIDSLEFRELNEHTTDARAVDEMVRPILAGRSAGVISEAGVPGVADPGGGPVSPARNPRGAFDRSFVDHPGSDGVGVERTVVRLQRLSAGQTARTGPGDPDAGTACDRREAVAGFYRGSLPECEAARAVARGMRPRYAAYAGRRYYLAAGVYPHADGS